MLLKFLYKIGDEMFLLGNQNQLDMLTISVIGGMIDTDFNWSFSLKTPID